MEKRLSSDSPHTIDFRPNLDIGELQQPRNDWSLTFFSFAKTTIYNLLEKFNQLRNLPSWTTIPRTLRAEAEAEAEAEAAEKPFVAFSPPEIWVSDHAAAPKAGLDAVHTMVFRAARREAMGAGTKTTVHRSAQGHRRGHLLRRFRSRQPLSCRLGASKVLLLRLLV